MSTNSLFLVFAAAQDGQEAEFNKWYSQIHIPDVLRAPGAESARRFSLQPQDGAALTDYLAIYRMSDPASAFADIGRRVGGPEMTISPALKSSAVRSINFDLAEGDYAQDAAGYLVAIWEEDGAGPAQGGDGIAVLKRSDIQSRAGALPAAAVIVTLQNPDDVAEIAAAKALMAGASAVVLARPI